jgi:NAD(P)H-dependent flavin oxidoreductase YrpB (nitropropane dioxygenase family)
MSRAKLPQGENTIMKSPICDMLGIEFPLFAFSHCRDVVAAVSRAGGFGVLGATSHSPETVEQELKSTITLTASLTASTC